MREEVSAMSEDKQELQTLELQVTGNVRKAEKSIDSLCDTLEKLKEATKGGCGLGAVAKELEKMKDVNVKFSSSTSSSAKSLAKLGTKAMAAVYSMKRVTDTIGSWVAESNNYVENMNLFNVSMGEYATSAREYAESVGDVLGIDPSTWMRNQGVFMTLGKGFGVATDRAAAMSQQLTQLGYDISSFFNISVEDSMQRLQSGISGELEPLRRLGYDLSQAKLEATALSLGIDKSVSSMTQAEKAELRYYAIMNQVKDSHGDMARTLEAPANQLRIFNAQVNQAARALGNIFIPALNAVLPYAIAALKVVRLLANAIANLVGFTMPEVDYSNITDGAGDTSDALEEATDNAKKFKKMLLGIDELNVLSDNSSDSSEDLTGGGFSFELPTYDFIGDASNSKINEIVEKMKEWVGITGDITDWSDLLETKLGNVLVIVGLIGVGIASWEMANGLLSLSKAVKDGGITKLFTTIKTVASIFLTLVGAITLAVSAFDAFNNGVDWKNLLGMLAGMGAIVGGLAISFGATGAAIGLLVGGLTLLVTGIVDAINGSKSLETALAIMVGILAIGGAIAILIGGWVPLVIAAIAAAVAMVVMYWDEIVAWVSDALVAIGQFFVDLWSDIVSVWNTVATWFDTNVIRPVVGFFSGLWTSVSGFFVNLWTDIVTIFKAIPVWFNTNVIQPVVGFFVGLWNSISTAASNCWIAIVTFFSPAIEWFSALFGSIWQTISDIFYNIGVIVSGCWEIIKAAWAIVSEWFDTNVIQPVSGFFSELWTGIKEAAVSAWEGIKAALVTFGNWIDVTIVQPVSNFFSSLWSGIKDTAVWAWNGIKDAAVWAWDGVKNALSVASNWINTTIVQPISKFFTDLWNGFKNGAVQAWEGIKSVFSKVGTFFSETFRNAWSGIVKIFSVAGEIFTDIKDGIISAFKTVVNGLIKGLNKVVSVPFDGINSALKWLKDVNIFGLTPFSSLKTINVPQIPLLADGGMISNSGQMFVAREAGPELVANVGSRTAVMNNDQIVESVSRGVYQAVVQAMGQSSGNQVVEAKVNDKVLFEVVLNRNRQETMRKGFNPLMGGV